MAEIQTSTYQIRFATEADVPVILRLIHELAEYEKASVEVKATEEKLRQSLSFATADGGFTPGYAKTLLVESAQKDEGDVAGMALYFHNYSTWHAAPGVYLEDLFVRPTYRGRGFGTALIQALARECRGGGGGRVECRRLEWSVLKWNEPSIRFYQGPSVNATRMEEWVGMRVDGERLEALASKGEEEAGDRP
jgi:GNAT superfamily N-acetyltransferase